MDTSALAQFGITMTSVPAIAALVNPTINQIRGAFHLPARMVLILAYTLSIALSLVLAIISDPLITSMTSEMAVSIGKAVLAGWAAATFAGVITDTQRRTDEKVAQHRVEKKIEASKQKRRRKRPASVVLPTT